MLAFRRILRALRLASAGARAQSGVSGAQLYVLRQLADEQDGASIGELAAQTLTDRSSVASLVERLVSRGLAERSVSHVDRRRAEVWITPVGLELVRKAAPDPAYKLVSAMDTLSDAELKNLAKSLSTLALAMGLQQAPAPFLFDDTNGNAQQAGNPG